MDENPKMDPTHIKQSFLSMLAVSQKGRENQEGTLGSVRSRWHRQPRGKVLQLEWPWAEGLQSPTPSWKSGPHCARHWSPQSLDWTFWAPPAWKLLQEDRRPEGLKAKYKLSTYPEDTEPPGLLA